MSISVFNIPLAATAAAGSKIMVHDLTQLENASTKLVPIDAIVKKPFVGVVGGGGAKDPVAGGATFQHDDLKGMGPRITIVIDGNVLMNYGSSPAFTYDSGLGTIAGIFWTTDAGLNINLNQ